MRGKDLRNETGVDARSTLRFQPSDFALPTVILALAGGLYLETTRFDPVPELLSQGVPPELFPRVLIAVLAVLAVLLPFDGRRGDSKPKPERRRPVERRTLLVALVMVIAALSLEFVGVLPTLAATTILLALAWGERRPWMLISYALTLPMFFFWFFSKGLNIYFEPGHLFIGR